MSSITLATLQDIPQLTHLLAELFTQEAEFSPDQGIQARGLQKIISNPATGQILVYRDDQQILGMVNLLFTLSTALGDKVALLEDMVVAPQGRNRGIGSALLAQAIEFAEQQGCKRITLLTDEDNLPAQRFYGRHGFTVSRMLPLRRSLI